MADITTMATDGLSGPALIRLIHLSSPSLPTGGFAYSQGLEWAVEAGWVKDAATLHDWVLSIAKASMAGVDIPLFRILYDCAEKEDAVAFDRAADLVLAFRETREMRQEEQNRGRALATLLRDLGLPNLAGADSPWFGLASGCHLAGFALASQGWKIPVARAAEGYVWAWLENLVIAAVKLIPLGQTQGQKTLARLAEHIGPVVDEGLKRSEKDLGGALPAMAIAGCRHETQYTRLYRS